MRILFGLLVCALGLVAPLHAEVVYVDDTLRVGVRPEPVAGGPALTVVTTGTPLEVLARSGAYMQVRTPNGVEGWVKSAYMTGSKPAKLALKEAEQRLASLQQELESSRSASSAQPADSEQSQALQARLKELETENALLRQATRESRPTRARDADLRLRLERFVTNMGIDHLFWLGSVIFFLALGFLFGFWWYKSQVTKRLGGFTL